MRVVVLSFLVLAVLAPGCGSSRSLHEFRGLSAKSELVLGELENSTAAVFRSDVGLEQKTRAMETSKQIQAAVLRVDLLAAQLAGVPMTDAEAAEALAMLEVAYRHLFALAMMQATVLPEANGSAGSNPATRTSFDAVDEIVGRLSVLTRGN